MRAAVALVSLAIVAVVLGGGRAVTSVWGRMGQSDQVLQRRHVFRKPQKFRMQIYEFHYPFFQHYSIYSPVISVVKATDHNNSGAAAVLSQGGPGYRNVTLHLISQHSAGLNFTIEVWRTKR